MSKEIDLDLLLDNIRQEIGIEHQGNNPVASVKLTPDEAAHIEAIKEGLAVEGRTFRFNPSNGRFTIDSSNCAPQSD